MVSIHFNPLIFDSQTGIMRQTIHTISNTCVIRRIYPYGTLLYELRNLNNPRPLGIVALYVLTQYPLLLGQFGETCAVPLKLFFKPQPLLLRLGLLALDPCLLVLKLL